MGKKSNYNQTIEISDQLYEDLKNYGKNFCIGMAAKARDYITVSAAIAIEMFYQDYDPIYYNRHYDNFRKRSFKKFYENKHNQIIRGGVELSSESMEDYYQDPKEQVFDMVYHGFHGVASAFGGVNRRSGMIYGPHSFSVIPPVMDPSPLEEIFASRDTFVKHKDMYVKDGFARADREIYKTLTIGG